MINERKDLRFHPEKYIRVYETPSGYVAGVTSIISNTYGSRPEKVKSLEDWKKMVGEKEANRISRESLDRGNLIHAALELYLQGKPYDIFLKTEELKNMFNAIKNFLEPQLNEVIQIETSLYHPNDRFAGRCDLIAIINGKKTIVDFKTSTKPKTNIAWIHDYLLQASAYAAAYNKLYAKSKDECIKNALIIIGVDAYKGTNIDHFSIDSGLGNIYQEFKTYCQEFYEKFPNVYDSFGNIIDVVKT